MVLNPACLGLLLVRLFLAVLHARWGRRRLKIRMEYLSAGKVSLSIIAVILIVTGGSLLVLGAIPVVVPMIGLPIILFAFGLFARDGIVVAAGYVLILIACVVIFLLQRNLAG